MGIKSKQEQIEEHTDEQGLLTFGKYDVEALDQALTLAEERGAEREREAKDNAYYERNLLVQALTRIYPSYLARHDKNDESWEKDWMWIVYINILTKRKVVSGDQHNHTPESKWFETKTEQVSWHIHDSEFYQFAHLPIKENNWDGHSTDEKYERLQALIKQ